jgi:hypothetical protein
MIISVSPLPYTNVASSQTNDIICPSVNYMPINIVIHQFDAFPLNTLYHVYNKIYIEGDMGLYVIFTIFQA